MRFQRFFYENKLGMQSSMLIASPSLHNHLKNVFRFKVGDRVILFDNSGYDYISVIESYEKDGVKFSIKESYKNTVLPSREVYLFASVVKRDNFEWIVEKATELGVSHIVPILSARSEKKSLNIDRLKKIIIEASEQSGRAILPVLHEILSLEKALEKYKEIRSIVWHPEERKFVSQDLVSIKGCFVGPEGGWSEEEIKMFNKHNMVVRSLGPQILRAETAVVSTLSLLIF